jgi:hypothetical protein
MDMYEFFELMRHVGILEEGRLSCESLLPDTLQSPRRNLPPGQHRLTALRQR